MQVKEPVAKKLKARISWLVVAVACIGSPVLAQIVRVPLPNSNFPISQAVWVGNTLYVSGMLDPNLGIQHTLEVQKLSIADVVIMHVYLVGDPAKQGLMDFAGFMDGYTQFFGTATQPNKPARSAMQVAHLAAPDALVEIEVIAVRGVKTKLK
jgi:enamine deaminase RidA (YjgF/YER057c/UK114 family)